MLDLSLSLPNLILEEEICRQRGLVYVAGVDEAGRGALAGPVVAAAVLLPLDDPDRLSSLHGVNDSKQLTPRQREALYDVIIENVIAHSIASVPAADIDCLGIVAANALAMLNALAQLKPAAQFALIDGPFRLKNTTLPQQAVVRGDTLSLSIAAASILAKVSRDRHMIALSQQYPGYGFAHHKGYATPFHQAAIARLGPLPIHRHTFSPIRQRLL